MMDQTGLLEKINGLLKRVDYLERLPRIPIVPWTDYSATSTIVGWSSFTTQLIYYKLVGTLVFVSFHLAGTSDATTVTFTLPYTSSNTVTTGITIRALNNGTDAVGLASLGGNSATVSCFATIAAGAWTNSGTKRVIGQFFYEMA